MSNSLQQRPFEATITILNSDGQMIQWDAIEESIRVVPKCDKSKLLTVREASEHFKVDQSAIYARAKRNKWKLVNGSARNAEKRKAERDWARAGEDHREAAFKVGHESVKRFKPKTPKNFRELEIADRIARRAAGLDVADMVSNTLVHINEAIEDHGEQQVLEAEVIVEKLTPPPPPPDSLPSA
jgi:hypothetical protein